LVVDCVYHLTTFCVASCFLFIARASRARALSVNSGTDLIGQFFHVRSLLPLLSHRGTPSLAKRICSFQTCFCKERKFLARLPVMGVIWSSYKENRKDKKKLKRFVNSIRCFYSLWKNVKKLNLLHTSWKRKTKLRTGAPD